MLITIYQFGFMSSLGLIVAIGAQNAFVLRQALRREQTGAVVAVSVLSDIALIAIGTGGVAWVSRVLPLAVPVLTAGGIAFLLFHGVQAARRAWRPLAGIDVSEGAVNRSPLSLGTAIAQAAAFSWLNPHAWLDTTVLIGSLAQAQGEPGNWIFAAGAASASATWFMTLAWAARHMAPWFARPRAWQCLDAAVALMMLGLAGGLLGMLQR